jgi:hypothetical protein
MNQNKLKTSLSISIVSKLSSKYKFFTIEKPLKKKFTKKAVATKTLTKVLVKHLNLSNHLDSSRLKYPLVINFFEDLDSFVEHLTENYGKNGSNIVFMSTGNVVFKQNFANKVSPLHLFNRFSSLFDSSIMLLRCLKLVQKS